MSYNQEIIDKKIKLRNLISKARESCAGSNIQDLPKVIELLTEAIHYSVWYGFDRSITNALCEVDFLLREAREYKDRLEPDLILCNILNKIDKEINK